MRSSIEVLESRIAPAGVVAVDYHASTGALFLSANDNLAHEVHVYATSATTFRIEAPDDTDIGGFGFYLDEVGKLTTVSYTGGNGDDVFQINNLKLTSLAFDGRDGVDTLRVADLSTTGNVDVRLGMQSVGTDQPGAFFSGLAVTIGGNFTTDYGSGGGAVVFDAITNTIKGGVTLTGGIGADQFYLSGLTSSVGKGISFTGNALSGNPGDDLIQFDAGTSLTVGKAFDGRAIFFDGKEGKDTLAIFGSGVVTLQGKVQFDGGPDDNKTTIGTDALTVNGDFKVTGGDGADIQDISALSLKIGGDFSFALGNGANSVDLYTPTLTVTKTLGYQGGSGTDVFKLSGATHTISGGLGVTLGDGVNTVDASPRTLKLGTLSPLVPALSIAGGADGDTIEVKPHLLTVTGSTAIGGGAGTNKLSLNPENGTFTQDVTLTGGTGDDTMEFGRDVATLKGNVTFTLGDGKNSLEIQPDFLTVTKDLKISGLAGDDTIGFDPGVLKLTGLADINLGDGSNVVDGYMTSATFGKTLTYTGGVGTDSLTLGGTSFAVKGAVNLGLAGGATNVVDLHATTITLSDALTIGGGDGVNTLTLGSRTLTVVKATNITLGSGGNFVTLEAPQSSFGALTVTTTGGVDTIQFSGTKLAASGLVKFDLGAGRDYVTLNSSVLALKAGLTYLGGADADSLNLSADGTITGDVNIDLGDASDADQFLFFTGNSGLPGLLKVTGALTLVSSATNTGLNNKDLISVRDVAVTKAISITAGAVDSNIDVNNASTASTFTLMSGAGVDNVQIETFGAFGSMTVAKTTTIMLGDGNDTLAIGFSSDPGSNDFVRFLGAVTVDGGIGTDTVNNFQDHAVNFFGPGVPAPVITNVP